MTPSQYRKALNTLGLSQEALARLLEITGRTSNRWMAGDVPIPKSVSLVLLYWIKTGVRPDEIS
jgi:DNA-binding transcriptional regulator YiaG